MAYEPKVGTGTVFRNKGNGPKFKGYFILPDGSVVGLALWEPKGNLDGYNISMDDREGAYHADKLGRAQTSTADEDRDGRDSRRDTRDRRDDRDDRRDSRDRRDDDRQSRSRHRDDDRDSYRSRDRDDRRSRHADDDRRDTRRDDRYSDDMDDEIPFP